MWKATLFALALVGCSAAVPTGNSDVLVLHEKRDGEPLAWSKHARAAGHQMLPMRIGLKQRNLEHADRFISEISDPASPKYGSYT